jgi:hypothetical protein
VSRIAVLYLSRRGNPTLYSRAFLSSLASHRAGLRFDLIYVLKGFDNGETDPNLSVFTERIENPVHVLRIRDEIFHIKVFFEVARCLAGYDRILFFNSYSRILSSNWLNSYCSAFAEVPNCGLVGATGGYETVPGTTFPNIGIRTNAFMISRDLFLALDPGNLETRRGGNVFEAGPNGMTKQVVRLGLVPVIVDKHGGVWRSDQWPDSRTFRCARQEGLLVSDNRTHHFAISSNRKRLRLAAMNWGNRAVLRPVSAYSRLKAVLEWHFPSNPDRAG